MQTLINFDDNQLKSLMFYTHAENESDAVNKAIEYYLDWQKQKAKRDLLAMRGQVDIEDNWQTLRNLELNE